VQTAPPLTPAESLGFIFRGLTRILDTLSMYGPFPRQLAQLIFTRFREIKQRFDRLAARLAAGTYAPRRYHGRKPAADPKPRRRSPLPTKFGWLLPLVPEAVQYRGQLERLLLRNPEMAALIAAAPAPMARILRPLCWMLRLEPPPILARPRPQAQSRRRKTPKQSPPRSRPREKRPAPPPPVRPAPPEAHVRGPPLKA
jgi:hypothetical protein